MEALCIAAQSGTNFRIPSKANESMDGSMDSKSLQPLVSSDANRLASMRAQNALVDTWEKELLENNDDVYRIAPLGSTKRRRASANAKPSVDLGFVCNANLQESSQQASDCAAWNAWQHASTSSKSASSSERRRSWHTGGLPSLSSSRRQCEPVNTSRAKNECRDTNDASSFGDDEESPSHAIESILDDSKVEVSNVLSDDAGDELRAKTATRKKGSKSKASTRMRSKETTCIDANIRNEEDDEHGNGITTSAPMESRKGSKRASRKPSKTSIARKPSKQRLVSNKPDVLSGDADDGDNCQRAEAPEVDPCSEEIGSPSTRAKANKPRRKRSKQPPRTQSKDVDVGVAGNEEEGADGGVLDPESSPPVDEVKRTSSESDDDDAFNMLDAWLSAEQEPQAPAEVDNHDQDGEVGSTDESAPRKKSKARLSRLRSKERAFSKTSSVDGRNPSKMLLDSLNDLRRVVPESEEDAEKYFRRDLSEEHSEGIIQATLRDANDSSTQLAEMEEKLAAARDGVGAAGGSRHATNMLYSRALQVVQRKRHLLQTVESRLVEMEVAHEKREEICAELLLGPSDVAKIFMGVEDFIAALTHEGSPAEAPKNDWEAFISSFKLPSKHSAFRKLRRLASKIADDWACIVAREAGAPPVEESSEGPRRRRQASENAEPEAEEMEEENVEAMQEDVAEDFAIVEEASDVPRGGEGEDEGEGAAEDANAIACADADAPAENVDAVADATADAGADASAEGVAEHASADAGAPAETSEAVAVADADASAEVSAEGANDPGVAQGEPAEKRRVDLSAVLRLAEVAVGAGAPSDDPRLLTAFLAAARSFKEHCGARGVDTGSIEDAEEIASQLEALLGASSARPQQRAGDSSEAAVIIKDLRDIAFHGRRLKARQSSKRRGGAENQEQESQEPQETRD
eukprot:TRINITY_DN25923_c0_g1_i1.p1 TRINITY_DN25923_c0_g1~~TRINITY_DN25923_c0_g1_i1.p1  ORF type:complete len:1054 (+),score=254.44 TRINITY_DN25923_c0_g1_i1:405-3164(+)